jgi:hypothetical protein
VAETKVTAKVTIEVDVYLSQPWGSDTKIADVYASARREAMERVRSMLGEEGTRMRLRVAKVNAIVAEEATDAR